jgi:hypothetical protein
VARSVEFLSSPQRDGAEADTPFEAAVA